MARPRPTGLVGPATARTALPYRLLILAIGVLGRGVFLFRPRLGGAGNLPRAADGRPAGRWIAAGLPHRTWVDPFLVAALLPVEPRLVFFGDGRAIYRSRFAPLGAKIVITSTSSRKNRI